jgi:hypothetical protein
LAGSKQKKKKKKTKLEDVQVEQKDKLLGLKLWDLRALVLKSLHKCFLYDNDQKILDSSNFQVSWFIVQVFPILLLSCFCKPQKKKVHDSDLSCSAIIILFSYDINTICLQPMQFSQ